MRTNVIASVGVSDLRIRIKQVVTEKRVDNQQAWALKAGLSKDYIATMLSRLKTGEVETGKASALSSLATAAGVSPAWLISGLGSPDDKPIPANMSASLNGSSTLKSDMTTTRSDEFELAVAIGECEDTALRAALKDFYRGRSDADATATVKHYLYGLNRSAERAKTEREWADEVRGYYNRIRKGAASPFGR